MYSKEDLIYEYVDMGACTMTEENTYIERDDTEKEALLDICKNCENFEIENYITKCAACACNISVLILYTYNSCPVGKW